MFKIEFELYPLGALALYLDGNLISHLLHFKCHVMIISLGFMIDPI